MQSWIPFWLECFSVVSRVGITFTLVLLGAAYLTYLERKIIAAIQRRRGPNRVGVFGLLQPIADAIKLLHKETIFPFGVRRKLFIIAPLFTFVVSTTAWAFIPFSPTLVLCNVDIGLLGVLAFSSLGVYGPALAGWSSQSTYGVLGALRGVAQMISYEVSLGLILASVLLWTGSANLIHIVDAQKNLWFVFPLFPLFLAFLVVIFAETKRTPFDLPEAETELVAGYHVEYASVPFALFFLAEYSNILLMSAFAVLLFLGGWHPPFFCGDFLPGAFWFFVKMGILVFLFILARASLPRFRYDQLMMIGWKVLLPFSLGWLMISSLLLLGMGGLPQGVEG